MKEPARIVAALDIASAVREALADALQKHRTTGWEDELLLFELGRTLGAALRWQDAPPSAVEQLVDSLRRVHAGLISPHPPQADEVVRELCPETRAEVGGGPTVQ